MDISAKVNVRVDSKDAVTGLGKLIDAVSGLIGTLNDPEHVVEMASAKKQAKLLHAEAKAEVAIVKEKGRQQREKLLERAERQRQTVEVRRQRNREAITAQAMLALPEQVNDEKLDEDWIYQFFRLCEDVGNEEMQSLWGRLLAGEVAQPGSFSLRTLSTVKLLQKFEAELFTSIRKYIWLCPTQTYLAILGRMVGPPRSKPGLTILNSSEVYELTPSLPPNHILDLTTAGLLAIINNDYQVMPNDPHAHSMPMQYFDKCYQLIDRRTPLRLPIGSVVLTPAGAQLVQIIGGTPDLEYHERVLNLWQLVGIDVSLSD